MKYNLGIKGRFNVVKKNKEEEVVFESGEFDNLITDRGLDLIGTNSLLNNCYVGSGSTPPHINDIALEEYVAGTSNNITSPQWSMITEGDDYIVRVVITYRFDTGVAEGTLTEIGMSSGTGQTSLFCRALIKDPLGNPTAITVLSDEILEVTYTHDYYLDMTDKVGQVEIGGVTHDYVCRLAGVFNDWSATTGNNAKNMPRIFTLNAGASPPREMWVDNKEPTPANAPINRSGTFASNSVSFLAYTSGNFYRDMRGVFTVDRGNVSGGISRVIFRWGSGGAMSSAHSLSAYGQCGFTPPIDKNSDRELTLTVRISWGRRE